MRNFFHDWRRKVGCVTLVVACGLLGGWVRSQFVVDDLSVRTSQTTTESLHSLNCHLCWVSTRDTTGVANEGLVRWHRTPYQGDQFVDPNNPDDNTPWHYRSYGIAIAYFRESWGTANVRMISYWYFITPLTLLSSYLLLVPSRKQLSTASQSHA